MLRSLFCRANGHTVPIKTTDVGTYLATKLPSTFSLNGLKWFVFHPDSFLSGFFCAKKSSPRS